MGGVWILDFRFLIEDCKKLNQDFFATKDTNPERTRAGGTRRKGKRKNKKQETKRVIMKCEKG
jgi:hypothetical protein